MKVFDGHLHMLRFNAPMRNLYQDKNFKGEIPDYWKPLLEEKIEKIKKLQAEGGENCTSFALIADLHWSHNAQKSPALLKKVMDDCGIPYYFNAGDTVASAPFCDPEFIRLEFEESRAAFKAIEDKCLMSIGNHDGVYSTFEEPNDYKENLTKEERFAYFYQWATVYKNRVFGEDYSYYYADDKKNKIRYVVLNTHDIPSDEKDENGFAKYNVFSQYQIRQTQLNWFAHVALDVPDNSWSVVLCSHENDSADEGYHTANRDLLVGVINAFKTRGKFEGKTDLPEKSWCNASISVDYTNRGGNFIVWVAGHMHEDRMVERDGIVSVCTDSDSCGWASMVKPLHDLGTTAEHRFDVFTINKKEKKVYITRIGFGEDREFRYE